MPKKLVDTLASGLEFIQFLGPRLILNNTKDELRSIYNSEFRERGETTHPNFSSVFHALVTFNKIYVYRGRIHLSVENLYFLDGGQRKKQQLPHLQSFNSANMNTQVSHTPPAAVQSPGKNLKKKKALSAVLILNLCRKAMQSDHHGIEITSNPPANDGKIQFTSPPKESFHVFSFRILNKGTENVNFNCFGLLSRIECFTLVDEKKVTRAKPQFLTPGESFDVSGQMNLSQKGYFPVKLYFEFQAEPDLPQSVRFQIYMDIEATVQTELAAELGPIAPYKRFNLPPNKAAGGALIPGVPPKSYPGQHMTRTVILKEFKCPKYLEELAENPEALQKHLSLCKFLHSPLNITNYSKCLHILLHLEEMQMVKEIRKYNLQSQTMTQDQVDRGLIRLKVPGVAENRPSILRGDKLTVTGSDGQKYSGFVHKIEQDTIKLGFDKKLLQSFWNNMKVNVEFSLNRLTLKLQHRAVDLAVKHQLGAVLFPSAVAAPDPPVPKLSLFNRKLLDNPQQYEAVQHIVAGSSKPAPYIVFGPPGTGKTITLVEAIKQITKADHSARILACAPCNSACDILGERLVDSTNSNEVYRMYASSRDASSIPEALLNCSNWDDQEEFFVFPGKEVLMKYKVIITTLFTAGRLVTGGMPVGHFSHVFVDEAGQAAEPECIIPVAGLLSAEKAQLVLAGDPEQLGPILQSSYAKNYGLELSLLERLMKLEFYRNLDRGYITKLLQNYRSHEAILKIPNELFYNNELQVFADKAEREIYCSWNGLPKPGFPVIFHGVLGKDQQEANSPSFFNLSEIEVLLDYLQKLWDTKRKEGLPELSCQDIGIITPYRKQVEKIKKALSTEPTLKSRIDLNDLKVGSVEEFQGQEKKIIMVSTVRSCMDYVRQDKEYNIGFLANKKRFNVALTRAKSLLIVVGNPVILKTDPHWEKFISYCEKMGGYTGVDFKYESQDAFVIRMLKLKILDSEEESNDDD